MAEILIIDDDSVICDILIKMMEAIGHEAQSALTGKEGMELAENGEFDIVFLDINLPDCNGFAMIDKIKSVTSNPEIIIITGESDPNGAEMAIKSGAWNYLEKPFLRQELNLQVSRALLFRKEKGWLHSKGTLKRNSIIGKSDKIKKCIDLAAVAAHSDQGVLISGEPGCGKELFAKTIHLNGSNSNHNFVVADCTAIAKNQFQQVLFGNQKLTTPGLTQLAHSGTLFLNEVSLMPIEAQKKLLKMIFREGDGTGSHSSSADFRMIGATSVPLAPLVKKGAFLEELEKQLTVNEIVLPPLRERGADVVEIALFFIEHACKRMDVTTKGVSPEFIDIISTYNWPGNMDEMAGAIDKAVASAKNEPTLYSIHLPSYVKRDVISSIMSRNSQENNSDETIHSSTDFPPLKLFIETSEKQYLSTLLAYTDGSVKKVCKISGLSRSSIYERLRKYGLT